MTASWQRDPEPAIQDCIEAFERLLGETLSENYRIAISNTLRQLLWPLLRQQGASRADVPSQNIAPAPGQPQAPGTIPPVGRNPAPFV